MDEEEAEEEADPAEAEAEAAEAEVEAEGEPAAPEEQAAAQTAPSAEPKGTMTRQRTGKSTPARPQQPKLAPKPISKPSKSKKKGKGAAKKAVMSLYGYWRSGCTWRVRLTLALKGFNLGKEVEYLPVHLVKEGGEQKKEAYTKMNPA